MASILLDRGISMNKSRFGNHSVSNFYKQLGQLLQPEHDVRTVPEHLPTWSDEHLEEWIRLNAGSIDLYIGNNVRVIESLRTNNWRGKWILNALGDLPRGATGLRQAFPHLQKSDIIWCSCSSDRQIIHNLIQDDGARPEIEVIPYGIDTQMFAQAGKERKSLRKKWGFGEDEFIVGYVGRITPEKNVHALIETIAHMKHHVKIRLVIVGDFDNAPFREFDMLPANLEHEFRILLAPLRDHVVHMKWRTPEELCELYNCMDVFMNLSLHHDENFGFTQIEALSCGVPVICSAWGGLKDAVNGEVGFTVDTWVSDLGIRYDMPQVIRHVFFLAMNPEKRKELGEQAARYSRRKYAMTVFKKNVLEMVERVLKNPANSLAPAYSEFGKRFNHRFGKFDASGKFLSLFPRYKGFSDPDYKTWIAPYSSRGIIEPRFESNRSYFLSLPIRIQHQTCYSTDLLWRFRLILSESDVQLLQRLSRYSCEPGSNILDYRYQIPALVDKGLIGYSFG